MWRRTEELTFCMDKTKNEAWARVWFVTDEILDTDPFLTLSRR